jgi:hypothetical protein
MTESSPTITPVFGSPSAVNAQQCGERRGKEIFLGLRSACEANGKSLTPMPHSRSSPSPRYRELAALYARMHVEGEARLGIPPEKTFRGSSLPRHVGRIKRLIDTTGARTILDYGSGKGMQYRPHKVVVEGKHVADGIAEYWDVDEVRCYDPGYKPYSALPEDKFDGVVCTDVLEHLPEEDLGWILDEIVGFAEKFVYLNVACFPAKKTLPNGENAHVTVREPDWWAALVQKVVAGIGVEWELHAACAEGAQAVEKVFSSADTRSITSPQSP